MTVHPGIGYDIISNHPIFSGSVITAAELDFKLFGGSVEGTRWRSRVVGRFGDHGVSRYSKNRWSWVNNLRLQAGREIVRDHTMHVIDLQDGAGGIGLKVSRRKTNAAYYLRFFCKSYSRMGGAMQYLQCDNAAFIHRAL